MLRIFDTADSKIGKDKKTIEDNTCFGGLSNRLCYEELKKNGSFAPRFIAIVTCTLLTAFFGFSGFLGGMLVYDFVKSNRQLYRTSLETVTAETEMPLPALRNVQQPTSVFSSLKANIVSEEESEKYHVPRGILVKSAKKGSIAERAGLKPGDIIVSCNQITVHTIEDLEKMFESSGNDVLTLNIFRQNKYLDIKFEITSE